MKNIELLAPAGSFAALQAAVAAGADAVYIGGTRQNARMAAENFDDDSIGEAIRYAKLRKVKVYVTMNTLNFGGDFDQSVAYAKRLEELGADALILQDLGLMRAIGRETGLPLHASTQCGVHNLDGVLQMKELGMDRVILAREMTLEQIGRITEGADMDLEIFIHGALCSSFSGQCYYSWHKGGRSGNCGSCAQPCRLPGKTGYPLSTRDLCSIEVLPELVETGVKSLKIEGRLKRPEYVAIVTACYREALDLVLENRIYDAAGYRDSLKKIYNRGGFTTGYYGAERDIYGASTPNHRGEWIGEVEKVTPTKVHARVKQKLRVYDGLSFGDKGIGMEISDLYYRDINRVHEAQGEVSFSSVLKGVKAGDAIYRTTDYLQMQWARQLVQDYRMLRWIQGECTINWKEASLELTCDNVTIRHTLDKLPERAKKKNITPADVEHSLEKLGDTVFRFDQLEVHMHSGIFLSVRDLNKLRREAVAKLERALMQPEARANQNKVEERAGSRHQPKSVWISEKGWADPQADYNLYQPQIYDKEAFEKPGFDGVVLPHITYDEDIAKIQEWVRPENIVVCNNIGQIKALRGRCRIWAGFGLNVVNPQAARMAYELGTEVVFASFEQPERVEGTICLREGRVGLMYFVTRPPVTGDGLGELKMDSQTVLHTISRLSGVIRRQAGEIIIEE